jgi:hypothetical protein
MVNYLTIGNDCSPAAALRNLNLRDKALPFDWVVSNINSIQKCLQDNFTHYHTNLRFNHNKKRLIDEYGFQFPHDYPLSNMTDFTNNLGKGVFGEDDNATISENWKIYYDVIKEKYYRRIERFKNICNDKEPIIVLCRWNTNQVLQLQKILFEYSNKDNIYFINSTIEPFENDKIKNIYTENTNIWNESTIWKQGIDEIILKYNL